MLHFSYWRLNCQNPGFFGFFFRKEKAFKMSVTKGKWFKVLFPRACSVSCNAGRGEGGGVMSIPNWKHSLNGKSVPGKWCNSFKPSTSVWWRAVCSAQPVFSSPEQCTEIFQVRPPKVHSSDFIWPKAMGPRIIIYFATRWEAQSCEWVFPDFSRAKAGQLEVSEGKSPSLRGWRCFHNFIFRILRNVFIKPCWVWRMA